MSSHLSQKQAHKLRMLIIMAFKLSRKDLENRLAASGQHISTIQFGVLQLLKRGSFTLSELSQQMMLEPATLVPVIDALVEKKYITREQDPKDRRRNPIVLTPNGEKIIDQIPILMNEDRGVETVKKMGTQKTEDLIQLLHEFNILMGIDEDAWTHICEMIEEK